MIWGGISYGCKSAMAFMEKGRRTAQDYVDVVYNGPLLAMMSNIDGAILMEDGAPIHRSNAPKHWREEHSLEKLDWPAQSPDLNPIEMAFAKLKALLRAKSLRTVDALWKTLGSLVDCFTPGECANFFRHDGYFQSP